MFIQLACDGCFLVWLTAMKTLLLLLIVLESTKRLRLKLFSHCGSIDCKLMSDWHLDLNKSIDTCSILTKFFQRSLKCLLLSVSVVFSYQHLLAILLQMLQPFFVVLEFCLNFKLKYSPQVHPFTFTHI